MRYQVILAVVVGAAVAFGGCGGGGGGGGNAALFAELDSDLDGIPNVTDPDMDGDGVPNETDADADGDGVPNAQDAFSIDPATAGADADLDGALDFIPGATAAQSLSRAVQTLLVVDFFPAFKAATEDTDVDGQPDAFNETAEFPFPTAAEVAAARAALTEDLDDDNDGIDDVTERATPGAHPGDPCRPNPNTAACAAVTAAAGPG